MMNGDDFDSVYWDSSAILSSLFSDEHSERAHSFAILPKLHLGSSLAWAEVHAVLSRLRRERRFADLLIDAAVEALETGPWRWLQMSPDFNLLRQLSRRWPLRGADLWHLATAMTLLDEFPQLRVLTFDHRLGEAAHGEGIRAGGSRMS